MILSCPNCSEQTNTVQCSIGDWITCERCHVFLAIQRGTEPETRILVQKSQPLFPERKKRTRKGKSDAEHA